MENHLLIVWHRVPRPLQCYHYRPNWWPKLQRWHQSYRKLQCSFKECEGGLSVLGFGKRKMQSQRKVKPGSPKGEEGLSPEVVPSTTLHFREKQDGQDKEGMFFLGHGIKRKKYATSAFNAVVEINRNNVKAEVSTAHSLVCTNSYTPHHSVICWSLIAQTDWTTHTHTHTHTRIYRCRLVPACIVTELASRRGRCWNECHRWVDPKKDGTTGGLNCFYPLPGAWTGGSSVQPGDTWLWEDGHGDSDVGRLHDPSSFTPSFQSLQQPSLAALPALIRQRQAGVGYLHFPLQRRALFHMLMRPEITRTQ